MENALAWIGGTFLIFYSTLSSIMIFVGVFFSIWGFKYKKDTNIDLRKKTHEEIIESFSLFMKNLNNDQEMIKSDAYFKLLTHFKIPITRRKYRDSIKKIKKLNFDQKLIFEQFKDYKKIEDDFYIRKNLKFNDYALKNNIIEEKVTNRKEIIFVLLLLNVAIFTETLPIVKIKNAKYDKLYKYIYKICM